MPSGSNNKESRKIANVKSPGRPAGSPNKSTAAIRECLQHLVELQLPKMAGWLDGIAKDDPVQATRLTLEMCEYVLPKLARTELVSDQDNSLKIEVVAFDANSKITK